MFGLSNVSVSAFLAIAVALFLVFNIAVFFWFRFFQNEQDVVHASHELEEKFSNTDDELPF